MYFQNDLTLSEYEYRQAMRAEQVYCATHSCEEGVQHPTPGPMLVAAIYVWVALIGFSLGYLLGKVLLFLHWIVNRKVYRQIELEQMYAAVSESMRPGSALQTIPRKSCQVMIFTMDEDMKFFEGSGVRVEDYIVVPTHCVQQSPVLLYSINEVLLAQLEPEDFEEIFTDVSVIHKSKLLTDGGVAKAKVAPLDGRWTVRCVSGRSMNNASMGDVEILPSAGFGIIHYTGSTIQGFSGGLYINVNTVLGMHLGGGALNYGVSLDLIQTKLRRMTKVPESSEFAAISKALTTARRHDVKIMSTGDPDEVQVQIGGRFYIVDSDEFETIRGDEKFLRFFLDDSEMVKSKGYKTGYRGDFEAAHEMVEDEPAFLDPRTSPLQEGEGHIGCPVQNTTMVDMDILQKKMEQLITDGLDKMRTQLEDHCNNILSSEIKRRRTYVDQAMTNMNELLSNSLDKIREDSQSLRSQVTQTLTSISELSSELSTLKAQQGSANLSVTPPSATPSVSMDTVFAELKQWRLSNSPSKPDYLALRDQFLTQRGCSLDQKSLLINRLRNYYTSLKQKARKQREQAEKILRNSDEPIPSMSS